MNETPYEKLNKTYTIYTNWTQTRNTKKKTNNPTKNTFYTYVKKSINITFDKEEISALELGFNFALKTTGHYDLVFYMKNAIRYLDVKTQNTSRF